MTSYQVIFKNMRDDRFTTNVSGNETALDLTHLIEQNNMARPTDYYGINLFLSGKKIVFNTNNTTLSEALGEYNWDLLKQRSRNDPLIIVAVFLMSRKQGVEKPSLNVNPSSVNRERKANVVKNIGRMVPFNGVRRRKTRRQLKKTRRHHSKKTHRHRR